ncbi:hypothetical protein WJX77_000460 [Trebouxia sp. C0004]
MLTGVLPRSFDNRQRVCGSFGVHSLWPEQSEQPIPAAGGQITGFPGKYSKAEGTEELLCYLKAATLAAQVFKTCKFRTKCQEGTLQDASGMDIVEDGTELSAGTYFFTPAESTEPPLTKIRTDAAVHRGRLATPGKAKLPSPSSYGRPLGDKSWSAQIATSHVPPPPSPKSDQQPTVVDRPQLAQGAQLKNVLAQPNQLQGQVAQHHQALLQNSRK